MKWEFQMVQVIPIINYHCWENGLQFTVLTLTYHIVVRMPLIRFNKILYTQIPSKSLPISMELLSTSVGS